MIREREREQANFNPSPARVGLNKMSPKGLFLTGLIISLQCFWELVESLRDRD